MFCYTLIRFSFSWIFFSISNSIKFYFKERGFLMHNSFQPCIHLLCQYVLNQSYLPEFDLCYVTCHVPHSFRSIPFQFCKPLSCRQIHLYHPLCLHSPNSIDFTGKAISRFPCSNVKVVQAMNVEEYSAAQQRSVWSCLNMIYYKMHWKGGRSQMFTVLLLSILNSQLDAHQGCKSNVDSTKNYTLFKTGY